MSNLIELTYINKLASNLRNFRRKRQDLFNFSCPICGDSVDKKSKARGYIYCAKKSTRFNYICHNCNFSTTLSNFLKQVRPDLYKEYVFEKMQNKKKTEPAKPIVTEVEKFIQNYSISELEKYCKRISDLDDIHKAKQYLIDRKIPTNKFHDLYYTDDYSKLSRTLYNDKYDLKAENDARIVIPLRDEHKNLLGVQGRSLDSTCKMRYITLRQDDNSTLVYNIENINKNETVYVLEGPFDSMFIPNSVAILTSNLVRITKLLDRNIVLVHDNEKRNKEIVKEMKASIESGHEVCFFPSTIKEKDINEMILSGRSVSEILNIINSNTYRGLEAKIRLSLNMKI